MSKKVFGEGEDFRWHLGATDSYSGKAFLEGGKRVPTPENTMGCDEEDQEEKSVAFCFQGNTNISICLTFTI